MEYFSCAGLRVPSKWTVQELQEVLRSRRVRLSNEEEVVREFLQHKAERELEPRKVFKVGV